MLRIFSLDDSAQSECSLMLQGTADYLQRISCCSSPLRSGMIGRSNLAFVTQSLLGWLESLMANRQWKSGELGSRPLCIHMMYMYIYIYRYFIYYFIYVIERLKGTKFDY